MVKDNVIDIQNNTVRHVYKRAIKCAMKANQLNKKGLHNSFIVQSFDFANLLSNSVYKKEQHLLSEIVINPKYLKLNEQDLSVLDSLFRGLTSFINGFNKLLDYDNYPVFLDVSPKTFNIIKDNLHKKFEQTSVYQKMIKLG